MKKNEFWAVKTKHYKSNFFICGTYLRRVDAVRDFGGKGLSYSTWKKEHGEDYEVVKVKVIEITNKEN